MFKSASPEDTTREGLAYAIAHSKKDVVRLLQKAGAPVQAGATDDEVISATLQGIKHSKNFRNDITSLLCGLTSDEKTLGLFGEEDVIAVRGAAPNKAAASTGTKKKSAVAGFFDKEKLDTLFNTGVTVLSTKLAANANKGAEKRALEIEQEKTKQALLAAQAGGKGAGAPKAPMSTGMKIGIAVGGAAVLGVVIYLIMRKK